MGVGVAGSRVAVMGGSIAGCAAAIALSRAGCSVAVFERSQGGLRDRGAGLSIPVSVRDELVMAGYLDAAMPARRREELIWLTKDGSAPAGRVVGRQEYPSLITGWTLLWRSLRARVPDAAYHDRSPVTAIRPDPEGVTLEIGSSRVERFDVLVGADGYKSQVRPLVAPEAGLSYGGYGLWRGDFPSSRLRAPTCFTDAFAAVGFAQGHGVFYLIHQPESGNLRQNWSMYAAVPPGVCPGWPVPMPRGSLSHATASFIRRLAVSSLPPAWSSVVLTTRLEELSLHPMYDVHVSAYTAGRLLLAGDAGALARPHTGAGALKAIQDARALERACLRHDTWERALQQYDTERRTAGNELTDLGKHLGRVRVDQAPDWSALTAQGFDAWLRDNTDGWRSHYDPR